MAGTRIAVYFKQAKDFIPIYGDESPDFYKNDYIKCLNYGSTHWTVTDCDGDFATVTVPDVQLIQFIAN
jgi:hypothetical protein